jgi:PhoPQ-activated pathogenicity-related protein
MKKLALSTLWLLWLLTSAAIAAPSSSTALDRYVAKPDGSYSYTLYHTESKPLYKTYFLHMVSQQWRSSAEVDRPIWEHDLMVTVPLVLFSKSPETAILIIDGGSNGGIPPRDTSQQAADLAVALGSVVAIVKQVPNQPLAFVGDSVPQRSEDAILAYTFDKFLTPATRDDEWPAHLPMTKAVVRAMDTIQEGLAAKSIPITHFVLYGGSKRGWTAWLTAAVDARVRALVPASIDLLNLRAQNRHHCDAYGFFTDALADYAAFDIPNRTDSPAGAALARIVDPYYYRKRYKMPKFILNSAGDQYFPSDSSQFYFSALPGPKLLRYTPNTDHAQDNGAFLSAVAWVKRILDGTKTPRFSWSFDSDETIRVVARTRPKAVRLWQATNPGGRDFRLESIGPVWTSSKLERNPGGYYSATVARPTTGWTAYFVELTFKSGNALLPDQVYTTDVHVTPDLLPYEDQTCH